MEGRERLELLCDVGSLEPIRSSVVSPRSARVPSPETGWWQGWARVDGRPVACYAQDASFLGGSLGAAHADTIDRLLQLAGPLADAGRQPDRVRPARECRRGRRRLAATAGSFARTCALSGVVPQISIIGGLAAGGGCYSPALTDFVVMTEDATMFLTGPQVVREVTGEEIGMQRARRSQGARAQWRLRPRRRGRPLGCRPRPPPARLSAAARWRRAAADARRRAGAAPIRAHAVPRVAAPGLRRPHGDRRHRRRRLAARGRRRAGRAASSPASPASTAGRSA